jgi:predicted ATPase
MLTRLRVSGFKNLVDVDVRFGPFTCIAGANGAGKSNLFDAIQFLAAITTDSLHDAALSVRDETGTSADIRGLFHRVGITYDEKISFDVEMIVPDTATDDLGQGGKASITFLNYVLEIGFRPSLGRLQLAGLEILREELKHINLGDASKHLLFPHSASWQKSAISGRRGKPFISTVDDDSVGSRVIELHQDGRSGRALRRSASNLPRTVLSTATAVEAPTALAARREMQSCRLLQLEPSALRRPDNFNDPVAIGSNGSHMPSTLYHLAGSRSDFAVDGVEDSGAVYSRLANRLSQLIDDVMQIDVDRDDKRELLTLHVTGRDGTTHSARALSDGTLRFLALAALQADPSVRGVICLEEPENGIHPDRIPAMLRLLQDIPTDVEDVIDEANPLRQVIINTHSPSVVAEVPDDSLMLAEPREMIRDGVRFKRVQFCCLANTWRSKDAASEVATKGKLDSYLNPITHSYFGNGRPIDVAEAPRKRVADRDDFREESLIPATSLSE